MAPDRGKAAPMLEDPAQASNSRTTDVARLLAAKDQDPRNFTLRGLLVGLLIGTIVCFSNMYFGLQTGWVSSMAMPSALLGFSYFKIVSRYISYPFTPVENVFVQSVAGSVGTMPLGCGFVGVLPALNYMLTPDENGPLQISLTKLIVWAVGIAFFGVVFAVPLRKQVIIRERLRFPSGTATAALIGVLHGEKGPMLITQANSEPLNLDAAENNADRIYETSTSEDEPGTPLQSMDSMESARKEVDVKVDWRARIRLLVYAFGFSALYTLFSYFVPLNNVPLFGFYLAENWLWTVNFSPAYVGQGIIMGSPTTFSMLLGAVLGYGILSPLAKRKGWAPGPVDDWETGSKGWIVWISLAIMLSDSLISLGWLVLRPTIRHGSALIPQLQILFRDNSLREVITFQAHITSGYSPLQIEDADGRHGPTSVSTDPDDDAPPSSLISNQVTIIGLILSSVLCVGAVHYTFAHLIPLGLTLLALIFAMLLSVMGVRALGETDLNPVSGISKLTQLFFAFVTPRGSKNAVIINLIAGALSESGALQAGDLMQDLKTGHLVGAAPSAQFYGQIIGSAVGAVVSAVVYKLYTRVYDIPGDLFQVPTGYVWIYTARLVTGDGLPLKVPEWALSFGVLFALTTILRMWLNASCTSRKRWANWVPGGIAVAVGMYNTPSFTIARTVGGLINWYWRSYRKKSETPIIVLASGFILGEGLLSIFNLLLASLGVPHL